MTAVFIGIIGHGIAANANSRTQMRTAVGKGFR